MNNLKKENVKLPFTKMSACSNDYIYINCFENEVASPEFLSIYLSDRHNGVGGDGVILICPSEVADAKMRMFNRDGSEGMMCGNGIRCVAKFLYDNGFAKKPLLKIETKSGIRECRVTTMNGKAYRITVDMGAAELAPEKVPVKLEGDMIVNKPVVIDGHEYYVTCASMGNPHCAVFAPTVDKLDLAASGPKFENNPLFPERVNVEFVEVVDEKTLKVRVWERGNGETMASGTGACAAVVAATLNGKCTKGDDVRVILKGGDLQIQYTDERVLMTGGAEIIYNGVVEV
ncbi:MAG: diaminopimelate epimerase [Clostridia bacterium]|nr:diaminopimelate epimerase [Clostridia bacterium]